MRPVISDKLTKHIWPHQLSTDADHAALMETLENDSFRDRDLIRVTQCRCHQNFLMLNFYTTYKFPSNFLCNWHELYYSPTFFHLPLSTDILLEFWCFCQSSEHCFHHVCIQSFPQCDMITLVTYKFQYSWRVWTSLRVAIVTVYEAIVHDIWCLRHLYS